MCSYVYSFYVLLACMYRNHCALLLLNIIYSIAFLEISAIPETTFSFMLFRRVARNTPPPSCLFWIVDYDVNTEKTEHFKVRPSCSILCAKRLRRWVLLLPNTFNGANVFRAADLIRVRSTGSRLADSSTLVEIRLKTIDGPIRDVPVLMSPP